MFLIFIYFFFKIIGAPLLPLCRRPWCIFKWNRSSGSGEEFVLMLSKYFSKSLLYPQFGNEFVRLFEPLIPKCGWNLPSGLPLENGVSYGAFNLYLKNLNPLHTRLLCVTFGWNWPSVSGEKFKYKTFTDWRRRIGD